MREYVFLSVKGSLCGGTSSLALRDLCAGVRLVREYVFLSVKGSLCGSTSSLALRDLCAGVRLP